MIALVALALAVSAAAQETSDAELHYLDGNRLWDECRQTSEGPPTGSCQAYVLGVVDTMAASRQLQPGICLAATMTSGQLVDVVRRYLAAHPERRHFTAATIVAAALSNAFPCAARR